MRSLFLLLCILWPGLAYSVENPCEKHLENPQSETQPEIQSNPKTDAYKSLQGDAGKGFEQKESGHKDKKKNKFYQRARIFFKKTIRTIKKIWSKFRNHFHKETTISKKSGSHPDNDGNALDDIGDPSKDTSSIVHVPKPERPATNAPAVETIAEEVATSLQSEPRHSDRDGIASYIRDQLGRSSSIVHVPKNDDPLIQAPKFEELIKQNEAPKRPKSSHQGIKTVEDYIFNKLKATADSNQDSTLKSQSDERPVEEQIVQNESAEATSPAQSSTETVSAPQSEEIAKDPPPRYSRKGRLKSIKTQIAKVQGVKDLTEAEYVAKAESDYWGLHLPLLKEIEGKELSSSVEIAIQDSIDRLLQNAIQGYTENGIRGVKSRLSRYHLSIQRGNLSTVEKLLRVRQICEEKRFPFREALVKFELYQILFKSYDKKTRDELRLFQKFDVPTNWNRRKTALRRTLNQFLEKVSTRQELDGNQFPLSINRNLFGHLIERLHHIQFGDWHDLKLRTDGQVNKEHRIDTLSGVHTVEGLQKFLVFARYFMGLEVQIQVYGRQFSSREVRDIARTYWKENKNGKIGLFLHQPVINYGSSVWKIEEAPAYYLSLPKDMTNLFDSTYENISVHYDPANRQSRNRPRHKVSERLIFPVEIDSKKTIFACAKSFNNFEQTIKSFPNDYKERYKNSGPKLYKSEGKGYWQLEDRFGFNKKVEFKMKAKWDFNLSEVGFCTPTNW